MGTKAAKAQELPEGVDMQASLMLQLAKIPNVAKASCIPFGDHGCSVSVQLSQRDLPANTMRKFSKHVVVPDTSQPKPITLPSIAADFKDATLISTSPSGRSTLIAKNGAEGKGCVLELWGGSTLKLELVIPASLHGSVYSDGWFGRGVTWNPEETQVVYVAEAPATETTPQWGGSDAKDAAAPKGWRGKGGWDEDWGELNTGKKPPMMYCLSIPTASVSQVKGQPAACSVGQPTFTPDGSGLVFVAWPHQALNFSGTAKRLGVVYCFNRPCALYFLPSLEQEEAVRLTAEVGSAFMPVFTPDGNQLLFLSANAAVESGVHNATNALLSFAWPLVSQGESQPRVIVPVVQHAEGKDDFPGLYCASIVEKPFIDDSTILFTSAWRSVQVILSVDVNTGNVTRVTPPSPPSTWTLLTTGPGLVVASSSTPSSPPSVHIASTHGEADSWQWQAVDDVTRADPVGEEAAAALSNTEYQVLELTPTVGDQDIPFEAIVIKPKNAAGPLPTVITPHGGPHSNYSTSYYLPFLPLVASGVAIVAVNYRGSTGYGEASIQSLPGKIGTNDVADCIAALDACIELGITDAKRVSVIGGSHGGFLTGHLLGQHPDRFRCGVLRNPVCNLSLMAGITDIMDWCYIEAFGTEEGKKRLKTIPTPEDLARFYEVSPASHVGKVTAPMAFMLGSKDRRVPLQDGHQFAAELKTRGVEARVIVFPEDTHALDKPQTEFEQWLNAVWWLKKFSDLD